jgi:hypothetical protein
MRLGFVGVVFAAAVGSSAAAGEDTRQIRIRLGERTAMATLNDSAAARDFAAMLPLSIRMRDHMEREKTGPVPGPLSERTAATPNYQSGDLGYWRPGGNFVIFYRHDGLAIPAPGIVILGRLNSGAEIFNTPGTVDVTVEAVH